MSIAGLLTPLGALFNNLEAGDIELPWPSIARFADVATLMIVAVRVAHRYLANTHRSADSKH